MGSVRMADIFVLSYFLLSLTEKNVNNNSFMDIGLTSLLDQSSPLFGSSGSKKESSDIEKDGLTTAGNGHADSMSDSSDSSSHSDSDVENVKQNSSSDEETELPKQLHTSDDDEDASKDGSQDEMDTQNVYLIQNLD